MYKFIFLTFAFLAWGFYEMSGGKDFEPATKIAQATPIQVSSKSEAKPGADAPADTAVLPEVARAATPAPAFDIRKPDQAELAAVDPAVLQSFGNPLTGEPPQAKVITAAVDPAPADLRSVTGNRVNMRNGPGTSYSVVASLPRGAEVEVLSEPGNGWLKLRVTESGRIGWMADFLVSEAD